MKKPSSKTSPSAPRGQFLIVTTERKGVFAGYGVPATGKTIRLEQCQMCIYWSSDVKGVVGLAATGPTQECKIGPPAPAITLQGVTSIMEVSKQAEAAWTKQPWTS